jgi:hypothetical protein
LEDIQEDPSGLLKFTVGVFPERADIEDNPGEEGMRIIAQVDDLGPLILLGLGPEREKGGPQEEINEQTILRAIQFISIL